MVTSKIFSYLIYFIAIIPLISFSTSAKLIFKNDSDKTIFLKVVKINIDKLDKSVKEIRISKTQRMEIHLLASGRYQLFIKVKEFGKESIFKKSEKFQVYTGVDGNSINEFRFKQDDIYRKDTFLKSTKEEFERLTKGIK